jgi:hypothetical protein
VAPHHRLHTGCVRPENHPQAHLVGTLRHGKCHHAVHSHRHGRGQQSLDGLLLAATPFNPALSLVGDRNLDQLARGRNAASQYRRRAERVCIEPGRYGAIETLKNTLGSYLSAEPGDGDFGDNSLWGLRVVQSNSMPVGQFLCGDFVDGAMLLDRMAATVELSTENVDTFVRNLVTIRAEERVALLTFAPWAFVKSTLTAPGTGQATEGRIKGPVAK